MESTALVLCNLRRMSIISIMPWTIIDIVDDNNDHKPNENCQAERSHHDEETSDFPDLSRTHDLRFFFLLQKALNILHFGVRDFGIHVEEIY